MSITRRILLIMPNNLGDVIMATPVPAAMKTEDPDCHITFFVEKGFDEPLWGNPHIDRIFCFDRAELRDQFAAGRTNEGLALLRSQLRELCAEPYDSVVNLCQIDYLSRLLLLIPAKTYVGRHFLREGNEAVTDDWSQYLYAIPFGRSANRLHASDVYRRIAGVGHIPAEYEICISEKERNTAVSFLAQNNIDIPCSRLIFLQPGASVAGKRWPQQYWQDLAVALIERGFVTIVAGSPSEQELAVALVAATGGRAVLLAGRMSFRESCAVLSLCSCCVSGDTAAMHAAAALKVRTVALFGPTSPVETGPYGNGHIVLSPITAGRPSFDLVGDVSLARIPVMAVLRAVLLDADPDVCGIDGFRTHIEESGDYGLHALIAASSADIPWYDPEAALITQHVFEDAGDASTAATAASGAALFPCIVSCESMAADLNEYMHSHDSSCIARMEKKRASLSQDSPDSSAMFLASILNIRLNAVALLDFPGGILRMRDQCLRTASQYASALRGRG